MSAFIATSVVLASLDPDEPQHAACDRLMAAGGLALYVYGLAEAFSARKAKAEVFITLDVRNFQALARSGDPRIESP